LISSLVKVGSSSFVVQEAKVKTDKQPSNKNVLNVFIWFL